MSSKMLIDASHPEETRVVVIKGNRVEEFDFEAANRKQLRGNIYLAKVTRVEPSLQAAFIDYGGNRHGFLAFSEIHPDYYQIPYADRQALLEEEARAHQDEDEEGRSGLGRRSRRHRRDGGVSALDSRGQAEDSISEPISNGEGAPDETSDSTPAGADIADIAQPAQYTLLPLPDAVIEAVPQEGEAGAGFDSSGDPAPAAPAEAREGVTRTPEVGEDGSIAAVAIYAGTTEVTALEGGSDEAEGPAYGADSEPAEPGDEFRALDFAEAPARARPNEGDSNGRDEQDEEEVVEQLGGDALEDAVHRPPRPRRHYKIQEVIKRRQILLVQVVKEERGNKGAALTTYLSLAGRYSVLMPNTARGGGISRKITDAEDRKRLKSIAQELDVPEGMGVILRTAGAARSNAEVKRDFEYLLRMWESVRELTLKSTAPMLVYEEGSLIKRSIRDLYTRDVEDVIVAGEAGFEEARDFMRMLMPSATKNVQLYRDPQPIFAKAGAEAQLDAMFSNTVTLRSGGYLVINQTEALVAIDVNSGRSTREHNIEDTAFRTNVEAADEIARQLRLRDLAGLIVVDFIDMEEGRNNRAVERRIKEALKNDRARIQIGRISHFGLLEMSRQRIRTGVLEGSTVQCPHCAGAGMVRSTASVALHVLRLLEDSLIKDATHNLVVRSRSEVALYILNQKRSHVIDLEARFGVSITVASDPTLTGTIYHAIERGDLALALPTPATRPAFVQVDSVGPDYDDIAADESDEFVGAEEGEDEGATEDGGERGASKGDAQGDGSRRRKRRRRRRGRDRDGPSEIAADAPQPSDDSLAAMARIGGDLAAGERTFERDGADATEGGLESASLDDTKAAPTAPLDVAALTPGAVSDDDPAFNEASDGPASPTDDSPPEPVRRRRSRRTPAERSESEVESAGSVGASHTEALTGADPGESGPAPRRPRRATRSRAAETAPASEPDEALAVRQPTADRDDGADAVEYDPSGDPAPATSDPEASAVNAPPPETAFEPSPTRSGASPTPVAAAEDDPARPKRSGWWQRAKATFGS